MIGLRHFFHIQSYRNISTAIAIRSNLHISCDLNIFMMDILEQIKSIKKELTIVACMVKKVTVFSASLV